MELSRILTGKKKLNTKTAEKISENLKLLETEKKYLRLMLIRENAKFEDEQDLYSAILGSSNKNRKVTFLDKDRFRLIADWHHLAILEVTALKDFREDPEWISRKLKNQISCLQAQTAISRLIRLGLLQKNNHGNLVRVPEGQLFSGGRGEDKAIQEHHLQMLEIAKKSISEQKITERHLSTNTLTIKTKDYARLVELVKKLNAEISEFAVSDAGDTTYQINVQVFRLTEN